MTNKKVAIPEPSMQTFLEWWKRYEVEKLTGLTEKVQATYPFDVSSPAALVLRLQESRLDPEDRRTCLDDVG